MVEPQTACTGHVALLGDSIFDNGAYVRGGPDVARQLRGMLPAGWGASLLAVDGATTADVTRQLASLEEGATLLVVSVGGNDALGEAYLLQQHVSSIGQGIMRLAQAQQQFARSYEPMIEAVLARGLPTAVCTIYDGNFPQPEATAIKAALALFNDVITRTAFERCVDLIDLRLICSEPEDYANPIEPSEQGGAKIAAAIAALALGRFETRLARIISS